jgi:two-component system cell cycle response regulator
LTSLYNHRHFYDRLEEEFSRAERYGVPLSLVFFDIDDFKRINDIYGHMRGDQVLKKIGQLLKSVARESDIPARYGGEEFAVILPHTECAEAQHIADRIMTDIRALDIEHAASEAGSSLTVSIGIASMIPDKTHDETTLVKIADDALYNAKRTGRNRITCAD